MHGYRRMLRTAAFLALALCATAADVASARPEPGAPRRGFRLFARSLSAFTTNRVYLGLNSDKGHIGVDSTGSSTIGGGFWPKGSPNQYVFNSGLQIAGRINKPGFQWDGEITGAFLFDPKGNTEHGATPPGQRGVFSSLSSADIADWPDAALVPTEIGPTGIDSLDNAFAPVLRGQKAASQGDVWFLTWDGDPNLTSGRPHPLGVVVESRGFGWNYPAGNEDIVYFQFNFYNITSTREADYAQVRPEIRPLLLDYAREFKARNEARFPGLVIPTEGYTIDSLFAAFAADMDVSNNANANYCSVNLPFALGYCYERTFTAKADEIYNPSIFGGAFFAGTGFVGVKYLSGPSGPGEIKLFSLTQNPGRVPLDFPDPDNVQQLWRYLSGNIDLSAGDRPCTFNPITDRICFVAQSFTDQRFFQSSPVAPLTPGSRASIVVAYIFAAPAKTPGFVPSATADVRPGDPRGLGSNTAWRSNRIDSIAGLQTSGWIDRNGNAQVDQEDFTVGAGGDIIPLSLMGKAKTAQVLFDLGFVQPAAPEQPDFFLVPGDNQVTVLWSKSRTETIGDPYFVIAGDPTNVEIFDPNYREFDVEGYRIYRGRVNDPSSLTLVAQFDYSGTFFRDFSGRVNPTPSCAPDLQLTGGCEVPFDYVPGSGVAPTEHLDFDISSPLIQTLAGDIALTVSPAGGAPDTVAIYLKPDTAFSGASGFPRLENTGVPFAYVDREVKNNFRFFYAVTAFDINSFSSGPSSVESARQTRAVTPRVEAGNVSRVTGLTVEVADQDGNPYDTTGHGNFTIDRSTGRFNQRPSPIAVTQVQGLLAPQVIELAPNGVVQARIDSVKMRASGEPYPDEGITGNCPVSNIQGLCLEYFTTYTAGGQTVRTRTPVQAPILNVAFGEVPSVDEPLEGTGIPYDAATLARYNNGQPVTTGVDSIRVGVTVGNGLSGEYGSGEQYNGRRAQGNSAPGGSRWFEGANETLDDPAYSIRVGRLAGVDTILATLSHIDQNPVLAGTQAPPQSVCMQVLNYGIVPFGRHADIELTWGAGGAIASVRDLTHNLDVPFDETPAAGWGFVRDGNGNGTIDWTDFAYVEDQIQVQNHVSFCTNSNTGVAGPALVSPSIAPEGVLPEPGNGTRLANRATVTPVTASSSRSGPFGNPAIFLPATGQGFGLYIAGHYHIFQLTGGALPTAGTRWVLRSYAGRVSASTATRQTTNPEDYTYSFGTAGFASTALPGLQVSFNITQETGLRKVNNNDLARIHTVPDPYYVTNAFEQTTEFKVLKFVNLPQEAIIRIYSSSGILVRVIEYSSTDWGGAATWDLRNRNNQVVASGVYFYHIESGDARRVGRFTVVNFAQ